MSLLSTYFKNKILILLVLLIIASLLRFYDLNWGAPFYFHPDERNIASAISQLKFPEQLNPKFFAYGSLPIYTVYALGVIFNGVSGLFNSGDIFTVTFEQAIIIGRVLSAVLSVGTIIILYLAARTIVSPKWSLFSVFLATFSVGLIQYAHFGTFELYLTFFSLLLLYFLLRYLKTKNYSNFIYAGVTLGVLCSIKISSLSLVPLPILALVFILKKKYKPYSFKKLARYIGVLAANTMLLAIISMGIFVLTNPFAFLDWNSFRNSMQYESSVALGTLPVFYTGSFIDTVPGLYQSLYVFPFLLNPIMAIISLPAFILLIIHVFQKKQVLHLFFVIFFMFLLIPQLVFFVKWTRYMVPTLPFIYLGVTLSLSLLFNNLPVNFKKKTRATISFVSILCIFSSVVWSAALIKTVYYSPDTRIEAAEHLKNTFPDDTHILSEVYDLGILPFNNHFSNITLFNFYDLEHDPNLLADLPSKLSTNDVIILPSQRIIKSRIENPQAFPLGNRLYESLNSSKQYNLIYKTDCDVMCTLLYLGDPVYGVEDTANVFDRPTLFIYRINHD